MSKKEQLFTSEAALCAAFIAAASRDGKWVSYAETAGWDLVLSRKVDGFQIGIQAKLQLNPKVVTQALPHWLDSAVVGPDSRAVLVPCGAGGGMGDICGVLGITVIRQNTEGERYGSPFQPALPDTNHEDWWWARDWHPWCPASRIVLPEYVPDVAAGDSAPRQLSPWKIKAIKMAVLLEERPVTRHDFKALQLSPTRWTDPHHGWLDVTPAGYVASPRMPAFAEEHAVNYAEIKADRAKWGKALTAGRLALSD